MRMMMMLMSSGGTDAGDVDVRYKKEHPDKQGEYYEDDDKLVRCLLLFINSVGFVVFKMLLLQ